MQCEIKLTFKSQDGTIIDRTFESENDLLLFLDSNESNILWDSYYGNDIDKSMSGSVIRYKISNPKDALYAVEKAVNEREVASVSSKNVSYEMEENPTPNSVEVDTTDRIIVKDSIGAHKLSELDFITKGGRRRCLNGNWSTTESQRTLKVRLTEDARNQAISESEYIKRHDQLLKWKQDVGIYIHKCFEDFILGKEKPTTIHGISEEKSDDIWTQVKRAVATIERICGTDAEYFPEFSIVSEKFNDNSPLKALIKNQYGVDADCISGTIDLLVRTKDGRYFMFDFKSSDKLFSFESGGTAFWSPSKKNASAMQLAIYARILKQYGITVSSTNQMIVPFSLSYAIDDVNPENSYVSHVNEFDLDKLPTYDQLSRNDREAIAKLSAWLPIKITTGTYTGLDNSVTRTINAFAPPQILNINLAERSVRKELNVEEVKQRYVKKLKLDPSHPSKYTYAVKIHKNVALDHFVTVPDVEVNHDYRTVYTTEENLDTVLQLYTELYKSAIQERHLNFGETVKNAIVNSGSDPDEYERFRAQFEPQDFAWIDAELHQYFKGEWTLVSSDDLLANGFFIFKKAYKGKYVYDVRIMSSNNLRRSFDYVNPKLRLNLPGQHATTVAGAFYNDDEGVDTKNVLPATYGNLLIMKVMAYLTENANQFADGQIRSIVALNIDDLQRTDASNSMIQSSWLKIMEGAGFKGEIQFDENGIVRDENKFKKRLSLNLKGLSPNMFLSDVEAYYDMALELFESSAYMHIIADLRDSDDIDIITKVRKMIEKINPTRISKDGVLQFNPITDFKTESDAGLVYLYKALLSRYHKYFSWEHDVGLMLQEFTAPAMSESAIQRTTNDLMASYNKHVHDEVIRIGLKWRQLWLNALKEMGITRNEPKFCKQYFFKDLDTLELYDLATFANTYGTDSAMYKAMEFLQIQFAEMQKYRIDDDVEHYVTKIPLVKGGTLERVYSGGVFKATKDSMLELWDKVKAPIVSEMHDPEYLALFTSDETRDILISEKGVEYFSTNLDYVFLHALQQQTQKKYQKQYTPIFTGVSTILAFMNEHEAGRYENNKINGLVRWADRYIESKFKLQNIMDPSLRSLNAAFSELTQLTSFWQLAGNTRAGIRESLTSMWLGATRAWHEELEGVNSETFRKGVLKIVGSDDKLDLNGYLHQQNLYFGMANMDNSQLADALKSNRYNLLNLKNRTAFLMSSLPDLYFRNAIMAAKLIADGLDEAYNVNDDGIFGYNFKKDPRFFILKENYETLSQENKTKYDIALQRYNDLVDDINLRMEDGTFDDDESYVKLNHMSYGQDYNTLNLYDGYLAEEIQGIRDYADKLYGHYNDENKMMVQETFLGHYLFQYRTFLSSRYEQNFNGASATNIVRYKLAKNPTTGKQLYIKTVNGNQIEIVSEEDVTDEDRKNGTAHVYRYMDGTPGTGMVTNAVGLIAAAKQYKEDPEIWHKLWGNPMTRNLLLLFVLDNFVAMLLMALLNFLYGEEKRDTKYHSMKNQDWWTRWSYGVLMGSLQDGPVLKIIGQIDSLNPPVVTQLIRWGQDFVNVVSGNDNMAHVLVENFGMTREFSNYFRAS